MSAADSARPNLSFRRKLVLGACVLVVAVGSAAYWRWMIEAAVEHAEHAAMRGEWKSVRAHLGRYLRWHPRDSAAHLLMAEALVKDDRSASRDVVERAIHHLRQIPDKSPLAAKARVQEARLSLLILHQPSRAEHLLQQALRLTPESYDANFLMWKLLDLTGRHVVSREYFWRVYELSSEPERPLRLRDWFFSEFYPETANEAFLRAFGAQAVGAIPASINLLVRLQESDPAAVSVHAALAAYYLEEGQPKSSLELLKETADLAEAMQDPFFVAVLFEALVDLGEFQKAQACFEQYPEPRSGYVYWRLEGIYHQYVLDDSRAAIESNQRALTTWPVKFDWHLMMRLSECLRKTGQVDEAQRLQSRVKYLTSNVLTTERTSRLRNRIQNLGDPHVAEEMRDLYREFGLFKEANAWEEHRQSLERLRQHSNR